MNVLIADDHDLVRDTLAAFLSAEGEIAVETVEDLDAACRRMEETGGFDLVLLDYTMPGMHGLEGLRRALDLNGGNPVAIMSGTAPRTIAQDALDAGAVGFLPKTLPAKSLVNAVRFMAAGETYVPVKFMTTEEDEDINPIAEKLSSREMQVLGGLCRGLANKEIARELELQEVTIKLHVKTLCNKLEAKNRTHAAMIAKEAGLF
ncbi:DNA-binding response regulator [Meridianimarinicoccus roseus]|uniref:DNA-binding response regulator n=1 Tax=Meridianimarinicoccus roseus TaxID=2072018 RepID=A0A2V2LKR4_9RHOB|nr:response regulator transcription factor [Meridianimarinicoccus roseus]PWR02899.1 DNA-binding response regulator [Meridianimarinicoccus roseus]